MDLTLVLMVVVCLLAIGHPDALARRDAGARAEHLASGRKAHPIQMAPSHGAVFLSAFAIGSPPARAGCHPCCR